jgi:poly-gamma-glutamate synthesis protein (capsule biosynthesis protein)
MVIGAHPHVIQPIKTDTLYNADSSEARRVVVAYSLGNFISNQFHPPHTDIGLMFEIEIVKNDKTGKTTIGKHEYIPVWRYVHNHKQKPVSDWVHTVIPVSAFESDSLNFLKMPTAKRKEMFKVYEQTCKHLNKYGATERKVPYSEIVKKGMLPPDEVVTPLPKVAKPFVAKVL